MAVATKNIGVDYKGTYAASILLEPIFRSDEIMQHYTVLPNVKYKQNVLLAGGLNKIVMANGGCSSADQSGDGDNTSFNISDKVIEVANVAVKMSQCFDTFKDEVIVESYKSGINMPDLSGTELSRVIIDRVQKGIGQDIVRVMWGGNTALTGGSNNDVYNWTDGLFKRFDNQVTPTTLSKASGTVASSVGGNIESGDAVSLLTQIFDTAPANLQQTAAGEKKMFVTPNIYNAYYGALTLIANAGSVDAGRAEAQSGAGYTRLFFRGVEVVPMYEWDTIFTDTAPDLFRTGDVDYKNGVVYAAKSNLMIGSDVTAPDTQLKMFFDEVTEKMYVRSYFKIGYQYGYNSLVHAGFIKN